MSRDKNKGVLLSIGLGGHSIEFPPCRNGSLSYGQSTLSGYYHDPEKAAAHSADDLKIGAAVLDKRTILEKNPSLAYSSPLVDVDLPDNAVDVCPVPSAMFASAVADNAYGGLLAMQATHEATSKKPGPLDNISLVAYVDWWRAAGARVGRWNGSTIDWETT